MRISAYILLSLFIFSLYAAYDTGEALSKAAHKSKSPMELYPIKDLYIKYGLISSLPVIKPVKGEFRISSRYGYRTDPITNYRKFHSGIDIVVSFATPVVSTADGKVVLSQRYGNYGRCVIVSHKYGYSTVYGHLSAYYCSVGDSVSQGQVIGFTGNTGRSTGTHLHYEIRKNGKHIKPVWYGN